jgi:serine protease Do
MSKKSPILNSGFCPTFAVLALVALFRVSSAQDSSLSSSSLPPSRFRNGEETLRAFAPVAEGIRNSIVKLNVDGTTVALGTVMDGTGLVLTKASEIKKGNLTCWLASAQEVSARLLATDESEDLALVRVQAKGLKPIPWGDDNVVIGQWAITPGVPAITPGVAPPPQAVGIVSALPHRIRPPRAFIGVSFNSDESSTRIGFVRPGFGAEQAGLKKDDVIVGVNGTTVSNREQVVEILREYREGQTIKLHVQRAEERFDADVRMMPPSADTNGDAFSPEQRSTRLSGNTSKRAEGFEQAIEHDTVLKPYFCGGPLVNLDGKAIGLNIARASRVSTYALPARLVRRVFEQLKSGLSLPRDN